MEKLLYASIQYAIALSTILWHMLKVPSIARRATGSFWWITSMVTNHFVHDHQSFHSWSIFNRFPRISQMSTKNFNHLLKIFIILLYLDIFRSWSAATLTSIIRFSEKSTIFVCQCFQPVEHTTEIISTKSAGDNRNNNSNMNKNTEPIPFKSHSSLGQNTYTHSYWCSWTDSSNSMSMQFGVLFSVAYKNPKMSFKCEWNST